MGLADLIKVMAVLQPDDEVAIQAVRNFLNIQLKEPLLIAPAPSSFLKEPSPDLNVTEQSRVIHPGIAKSSSERKRKTIRSSLSLKEVPGGPPPEWLGTIEHYGQEADRDNSAVPLDPLFRKEWTRHILTAILSTVSRQGRIDMRETLSRISRVEVIDELPRTLESCVVPSIQLLVDQSEAMEPYYMDQAVLKQALIELVGKHRIQVIRFSGFPLWGILTHAIAEYAAYSLPPTGTLVLLLTDLGLGRPKWNLHRPLEAEWRSFARYVRAHGCELATLVPYGESRVAPSLQKMLSIVEWCRMTSVVTLKRRNGGIKPHR